MINWARLILTSDSRVAGDFLVVSICRFKLNETALILAPLRRRCPLDGGLVCVCSFHSFTPAIDGLATLS